MEQIEKKQVVDYSPNQHLRNEEIIMQLDLIEENEGIDFDGLDDS